MAIRIYGLASTFILLLSLSAHQAYAKETIPYEVQVERNRCIKIKNSWLLAI